jgi:hypothetical protein
MPLTPRPLPENLVSFCDGGTRVQLNVTRYRQFARVVGSPEMASVKPDRSAAEREAYAALLLANLLHTPGAGQCVYLGKEAAHFLYGRANHANEMDCDVVARVLYRGSYGFALAEGKGSDLAKAHRQFQSAQSLLRKRGAVHEANIVTNNLRWLEWNQQRRQWEGQINNRFDRKITEDIQEAVLAENPPLLTDKLYLLDSPHADGQLLPGWCVNRDGIAGDIIYVHDRSGTGLRTLRKVLVGAGPIHLVYVT